MAKSAIAAYRQLIEATKRKRTLLSASGRLNVISAFLSTDKRALLMSFDLYGEEVSFFDDLFSVKNHQVTTLLPLLEDGFKTNRLVRDFCMSEMAKCFRESKYSVQIKTLKQLDQWGVLSSDLSTKGLFSQDLHLKPSFMRLLVDRAVIDVFNSLGNPLLAAAMANIRQCPDSVPSVIWNLCVDQVVGNEYNCQAILVLLQKYPDVQLLDGHIERMANFFLDSDMYHPSFSNRLFESFLQYQPWNEQIFGVIKVLAARNIECGNVVRALGIIRAVEDKSIGLLEPKILLQFIEELAKINKGVADVLAEKLYIRSPEYLLQYFGVDSLKEQEYKAIIGALEIPLPRDILGLLFESLIYRGGEKSSELVLRRILELDGLLSREMAVLVRLMMEKGQHDRARSLLQKTSDEGAGLGYIAMLESILADELKAGEPKLDGGHRDKYHESTALMKVIRTRYASSEDFPHDRFMEVVLRHTTGQFGVRAAVQFFRAIRNPRKRNGRGRLMLGYVPQSSFLEEAFGFIQYNPEITLKHLSYILSVALQHEDRSLAIWCVKEMRYEGMSVREVLDYVSLCSPDNGIVREEVIEMAQAERKGEGVTMERIEALREAVRREMEGEGI